MKTCTKCGKEKPLEEFHKNCQAKDGRRSACSLCINAYARAVSRRFRERLSPGDKVRLANDQMQRRYGITLAGYGAVLDAQGGGCASAAERPRKKGNASA